jgi:TRAP-type mannitol/chloroaromatic compound transport system permease small subunit
VQFVYGGALYLILKRLDWISLPIVLLAYLAPVIAFSWHASDTTNDIIGTIPWIVFALIVGLVSWFFAAGAGINMPS